MTVYEQVRQRIHRVENYNIKLKPPGTNRTYISRSKAQRRLGYKMCSYHQARSTFNANDLVVTEAHARG